MSGESTGEEPQTYFKSGQWWSAKQGDWIGKIHILILMSKIKQPRTK